MCRDGICSLSVRNGQLRPHMRFVILSLQTMMSSQVHPPNPRGGRINPSIYDVILPTPARPGIGNLFRDRGCGGGARRDRTDDLMLAKHALYQLSYGPLKDRAQRELSLFDLSARGSTKMWWAQADSNRRPHAYQACALTN
jgi:hypothetical protein